MNYDRRVIEKLKKKHERTDFPFLRETMVIACLIFLILALA